MYIIFSYHLVPNKRPVNGTMVSIYILQTRPSYQTKIRCADAGKQTKQNHEEMLKFVVGGSVYLLGMVAGSEFRVQDFQDNLLT